MGLFENDTVIWRRGNNEILAAGINRVTQDRRISVLHDERKCDQIDEVVGSGKINFQFRLQR